MAVLPTAPARQRPRPLPARRSALLPLISVVIVNYRRWEETAALVDQLAEAEPIYRSGLEIVVVDNASSPSPLEAAICRHPQVTLVRLAENRGFAAGVNTGFRRTHGRWVLVLNPDLVVSDGFVDLICAAALELDEDAVGEQPVGVLGFQLRNRDGSLQLSTGLFPSIFRQVLGLLRPRRERKYEDVDLSQRTAVPWVTGSCLLVRRDCLSDLEGFDEDFFLYYEDVDLCRRAQAQGWAVCYEPAVKAIHLDPLQNRPLTAPMRAITRHASLTYFHKHLSGWQFWMLAQLIHAEAGLVQRLAGLKGDELGAAIAVRLRQMCKDFVADEPAKARARLQEILDLAGMHRAVGRATQPDPLVAKSACRV